MNRIDRLFGMLTLLQSRKYVTAEQFAQQFGTSVRTVYRDVKALGEQGVPVSFEPHKGYFVVQGYFLPPVSFSSEEANALLLVERMVLAFADQSIHTHYSNALDKVKAMLRMTQKEKLEALQPRIQMQIPACFNHNFAYLSTLQQAISAKVILELTYKNNRGETSQRRVEPIGLIFYAFGWHLIAWCHVRHDYRDFKVARIQDLKNTGVAFHKSDHMALSDYLKLLPVDY